MSDLSTLDSDVHDDDWVPVEHRIAGLDRRTLPAAIGVLVVALVFIWVIPAIDDAVSNDDEIVAGEVMSLGGGVTFAPAVGWGVDSGVRVAADFDLGFGGGSADLFNGAVEYIATTGVFEGDASELLDQLNDNNEAIEGEQGFHVTSEQVSVTTTQGLTGVQEAYTGTGGTGTLTAFVIENDAGDSIGVQIVALGPDLEMVNHADEIETMTASLRFDPPSEEES